MSEHVVILGAGYAGLLAALRLAKRTKGWGTRLTLVNARPDFVERIRLHELAAGRTPRRRGLAELVAGTGVELRLGMVSALRPATRELVLEGETLGYDRLIYALGSRVDTRTEGVAEHAYRLDGGSAERLAGRLPEVAARGGRLLVVGGGSTGIEAASELAERYPGLKVTLVCQEEVGNRLSQKGRNYVRERFAELGIAMMEGIRVRGLGEGVARTDGGELGFDVCVWAGGLVAAGLAREAGLAVSETGQLLVDEKLRSLSDGRIYGAGDGARLMAQTVAPIVMSCKTAMPMGAHAADNVARALKGQNERRFAFGDTGVCLSLGRRAGLIQLHDGQGRVKETVLRGRAGAWLKERVCRMTMWAMGLERQGIFEYQWRRLVPEGGQLTGDEAGRLAA